MGKNQDKSEMAQHRSVSSWLKNIYESVSKLSIKPGHVAIALMFFLFVGFVASTIISNIGVTGVTDLNATNLNVNNAWVGGNKVLTTADNATSSVNALTVSNASASARLTALESSNGTQQTLIAALQASNTSASARLAALESSNGTLTSAINLKDNGANKTVRCIVDPSGKGDYATLTQDALDACAGGEIMIRSATYNLTSQLYVRSNTILEGEGRDSTILKAASVYESVLTALNTTGGVVLEHLTLDGNHNTDSALEILRTSGAAVVNHILIEDVVMENNIASGDWLVQIVDSNNEFGITDMTIRDSVIGPSPVAGGDNLVFSGVQNLLIDNTIFTGLTNYANFYRVDDLAITNSKFTNDYAFTFHATNMRLTNNLIDSGTRFRLVEATCGDDGCNARNVSGSEIIVANNNFLNGSWVAFQIEPFVFGVDNVIITSNTFDNPAQGAIILFFGGNTTINNVLISGNAINRTNNQEAVYIDGNELNAKIKSLKITDNIIKNTNDYGILVDWATNYQAGNPLTFASITGNLIQNPNNGGGSYSDGIIVKGCHNCMIANNLIYDDRATHLMGNGIDLTYSDNISISGNMVYGATAKGITLANSVYDAFVNANTIPNGLTDSATRTTIKGNLGVSDGSYNNLVYSNGTNTIITG